MTNATVKHIPEWVPGITFKTAARICRRDFDKLCEVPYAFVKQQMVGALNYIHLACIIADTGFFNTAYTHPLL
jgi:hypothetical protein